MIRFARGLSAAFSDAEARGPSLANGGVSDPQGFIPPTRAFP